MRLLYHARFIPSHEIPVTAKVSEGTLVCIRSPHTNPYQWTGLACYCYHSIHHNRIVHILIASTGTCHRFTICIQAAMQVLRNRSGALPNTSSIADDRLRQAAERFHEFKAKLQQLRVHLRTHYADLVRVEASRSKVVQALNQVSRGSPLFDLVGGPADESNPVSFATVHYDYGTEASTRLDNYQEEVIAYVTDWERTVTTRVATELKHVEKRYKEFERYHLKVETLKSAVAKKKTVKDTDHAKISRNESKLRTARKEYRRNLVSVTLLTEEVTERGWKDLLPLVVRMIEHDVETSNKTAELMGQLSKVQEELEALGQRYQMEEDEIFNGRLKVLLEEDAMEFVKPEDMQDIESIQASINTFGRASDQLRPGTHNAPGKEANDSRSFVDDAEVHSPTGSHKTPPCSEADSLSPEEAKGIELTVNGNVDVAARLDQSDPAKPFDEKDPLQPSAPPHYMEEKDDHASILNYPTSIYLRCDENKSFAINDDETTLTPYPDMASV